MNKNQIYALFSFILLPALNIYCAFHTDFLYQNYSYAGNEGGHPISFYLWGISCGFYFYHITKDCMKLSEYRCKGFQYLLLTSTICMALSVLIPYFPNTYPILGQIHIFLSIFATVSYILVLYHYFYDLMYKQYQIFRIYHTLYTLIIMVCLVGYFKYGCVNSMMEYVFSGFMPLVLFKLFLSY